VPATVETIAEPRILKTVLSPVAALRRCLDTNVLFVPPEELLELEEESLEELELSYFSIFTPPLSYVFVAVVVLPSLPAVTVLTALRSYQAGHMLHRSSER
jgi:hypothetical protein